MRKVPAWVRPLLLGGGILNLLLASLFLLLPNVSHTLFFGEAAFLAQQALLMYGVLLATCGVGYIAFGLHPLNNVAVLPMGIVANLFVGILLPLTAGSFFWQSAAVVAWTVAALGWSVLLARVWYYISKARQVPQVLAHPYQEPLSKTLSRFRTQRGKGLLQLSNEQPTLIIFLRHFGSTFCRETLADLHQQRHAIESQGTQLVLVHLSEEEEASAALESYGLTDLHRISDPNGIMYNAFGLTREDFGQLASLQSWLGKAVAGVLKHRGQGRLQGRLQSNGFRTPGVFLINKGEIVRSYRHRYASERPDYLQLATDQAA